MGKYLNLLKNRIDRGGSLPIGYDLYNKSDVNDLLPTHPASYGIGGRICTTLIFEVNEDGEEDD